MLLLSSFRFAASASTFNPTVLAFEEISDVFLERLVDVVDVVAVVVVAEAVAVTVSAFTLVAPVVFITD